MTSLSVVIVTYNSASYIEECLNHLYDALAYINSEVFVIDNASSDGSADIAEKFMEGRERENLTLEIIRNEENIGFAPANNMALQKCKGDYAFLMNPDVFASKDSLKLMIEFLHSNKDVGAIGPKFIYPDGKIQPSCRRFPTYGFVFSQILGLSAIFRKSKMFNGWKMGDFAHDRQMDVDQPMGAGIMVTREVLDKVGILDEQFVMFFNDVDWCRRIADAGFRRVFYPDAVVTHLLGASIKKNKPKMILMAHIGYYLYFEKYFRDITQRPMNQLMGLILFLTAMPRILYHKIKEFFRA